MLKVAELVEELRLVDDGFGKICHMVNDNNMKVRAEALRLLVSHHSLPWNMSAASDGEDKKVNYIDMPSIIISQ